MYYKTHRPVPIVQQLGAVPVGANYPRTRLGRIGTLVMIRMMAFVLLCIGIEIIWTDWAQLNGLAQDATPTHQ